METGTPTNNPTNTPTESTNDNANRLFIHLQFHPDMPYRGRRFNSYTKSTAATSSTRQWESRSPPSHTRERPTSLTTSLKPSYTKHQAEKRQLLWGSSSKDWILASSPNFFSVPSRSLRLLPGTEKKIVISHKIRCQFCHFSRKLYVISRENICQFSIFQKVKNTETFEEYQHFNAN